MLSKLTLLSVSTPTRPSTFDADSSFVVNALTTKPDTPRWLLEDIASTISATPHLPPAMFSDGSDADRSNLPLDDESGSEDSGSHPDE